MAKCHWTFTVWLLPWGDGKQNCQSCQLPCLLMTMIVKQVINMLLFLHYHLMELVRNQFWLLVLFVVTSEDQIEALCCYLALPSNLFQLFHNYSEIVDPLIQRYTYIISTHNFHFNLLFENTYICCCSFNLKKCHS